MKTKELNGEEKEKLKLLEEMLKENQVEKWLLGDEKKIMKYRALTKAGLGFIRYINNSSSETYIEDATFASTKGLTVLEQKVNGKFKVTVEPAKVQQINVIFEINELINSGAVNMNYKYQMSI